MSIAEYAAFVYIAFCFYRIARYLKSLTTTLEEVRTALERIEQNQHKQGIVKGESYGAPPPFTPRKY